MDIATFAYISAKPQRGALPAAGAGHLGSGMDMIGAFSLENPEDVAVVPPNATVLALPQDEGEVEDAEVEPSAAPDEPSDTLENAADLPINFEQEARALAGISTPTIPGEGGAIDDDSVPEPAKATRAAGQAELRDAVAASANPTEPTAPKIAPPPDAKLHTTGALAITARSDLPVADIPLTDSPKPMPRSEVTTNISAQAKPAPPQPEFVAAKAAPAFVSAILAPTPQAPAPASLSETASLAFEPAVQVQFGVAEQPQACAQARLAASTAALPAEMQRAQHVATQITGAIRAAESDSIELRLDPPELGRVLIKMSMHDGELRAVITAERAETSDLMRRHADILGREMARAGLAGANLSFQSEAEQRQNPHDAGTHQAAFSARPKQSNAASLSAVTLVLAQDGRLDIRL